MTTILATPSSWPRSLLATIDPGDGAGAIGAANGTGASADLTTLDGALKLGAFAGLRRAIDVLGPAGTLATIQTSGLRGRGGAGHATADKWRTAATTPADRRFVVANGYGADPAVFIDATLMERNPFAVIEGLAIAAYTIGATEGVIAVRAEYTGAIRRLEAALAEAEDAGFVGLDVLGSGWDLAVTVRTVQGAYMLGEETVLLKALEGKRGQPEQRPPFPAERGLFGQPTVVQNIATLIAVPWILVHGADAFAAIGSPDAPGTMLVQVRGIGAEGIAEVPTGTPLREIVGLVGGAPAGHTLKAVLVGGPSGGLLPPEQLDTPYQFDALRAVGAHVGSGSVVLADERVCVVDLARLLTRFCADEACGKTIPCRIGTRRLSEIGERITSGRPKPTDLQLMTDLSHDIVESGLCDHERLTTLPFASGMRYFRSELDQHILNRSCPAGVCHPIAVAGAGAH
jgi:NADH:ubiquinone oxidoreductase subunit F (NADH-binding)